MKRMLVAVAMLCCLSLPVFAGEVTKLPVEIKPDNKDIVYIGRFSDDYRFDWTGSAIRFKFKGTAANAELKLVRGGAAGLQIIVDGEATKVIIASKDQELYNLAEGLEDKEHVIEIFKRTEGYLGMFKFNGLQLSKGAKLLPEKLGEKKIMVIGDSITCGYGNEAPDVNQGNTPQNENGYMSYAPIAARELGAEVSMVCCSGRGMYRNRDKDEVKDKNGILPIIFEQTLFNDGKMKWDHKKYVPQVVVINLGTNDGENYKGGKSELKKEDFLGAYKTFIKRLKELYPDVKIIASIGPMRVAPIDGWLKELAAEDESVFQLTYPGKGAAEYRGGHWHPSVKMDKVMAKLLADKIKEVCDWK
ncbi:MAG: hypothetical protein JXR97_05250 [Planctomycetes bacterium]|nr:hypothetical protein [Planctomycetota bacterium]